MKKLKPFSFLMLFAGLWLLSTSYSPRPPYSYTAFFMKRADLERSVSYADGKRQMLDPGKIWVRGDQIFVVERYKGIHIIDNSTPATPLQTGFIVAPGCMDVAIKGNIIYIDNAVDLVAFDLTTNLVTERLIDLFPEPSPPSDSRYYDRYNRPEGMILVGWKKAFKDE